MTEPIRVLHILQRMEAAGVQTLLMNIYRKIDRTKVQFDFLVHYKERQFFDDEIEALGGKIYRLSVREDYNFFRYYRELNLFFKHHKEYKIVHGHMHSLGAIYLHVAKKHGIKVRIAHSHTNNTQHDFKRVFKLIMNRLYAHNATKLFACSKSAGIYMFGKRNFEVINNAIITDRFIFSENIREKKRRELGVEKKIVVGCVGRFEKQKNQLFSIRIFETLYKIDPRVFLLFVGTGSMEEEIKELVKKKKLSDSVVFLGNRNDVAELYQAMDVFLMPSLFEGLGIVGIEAQAAGTPMVCTDTLPCEINVTPLIKRVSLDASVEKWSDAIIEISRHPLTHSNMKKYIVDAHYDMDSLVKRIQKYYLMEFGFDLE